MIKFLGQRLLVMVTRWIIAGLLLVIVMELSFGVLGGSEIHVWEMSFEEGSIPLGVGSNSGSGWAGVVSLMKNSLWVVGLAWGVTLFVGYPWGILSARLRGLKGHYLLPLPWAMLASVPGFWWVIQVAIYSYLEWERPGFANEIVVESGPDLMRWWNMVVVALPLGALGIALQMRSVSDRIREEAALPFARGLYRSGYSESEIFYRNVLRRLKGALIERSDETLPVILGGMMFVEVAFRFDGMGGFLLRSLQQSYFPGALVVGLWMAGLIGLAALIRELIVHALAED
ncbi:MAG: hypothetical protein AAF357_14335 [Verrucomicrobiota bacterium]